MSMTSVTTRVDQLRPGDTVTGTAASGPFDDGPRVLISRTEAPEHSQRTTAWWCAWEAGGHNVFYGDTLVDVQRLGAAVSA